MSIFENAINSTKQGDIGEARAIYEYTKLGYGVCRTLFDSMKYDLVVDIDGELKKVQVKTTDSKTQYGVYTATLKTSGSNSTTTTVRLREDNDYDILFVLASDGECWSIPVTADLPRRAINLGKQYDIYRL